MHFSLTLNLFYIYIAYLPPRDRLLETLTGPALHSDCLLHSDLNDENLLGELLDEPLQQQTPASHAVRGKARAAAAAAASHADPNNNKVLI